MVVDFEYLLAVCKGGWGYGRGYCLCLSGSFVCVGVVAGAFDEGLEISRSVCGEPSCVEVSVPCVVYKGCV